MSADAPIPEEWVEAACAAAFAPPISDDRRADMRAALEVIVPLAELRTTRSLMAARIESEGR